MDAILDAARASEERDEEDRQRRARSSQSHGHLIDSMVYIDEHGHEFGRLQYQDGHMEDIPKDQLDAWTRMDLFGDDRVNVDDLLAQMD